MIDGIVLIDKPRGWSSFDVVAKVRSVLRQSLDGQKASKKVKVGHAGTLDPLAEGLLIVLVGSYTKKMSSFESLNKVYRAHVFLGQTSTTADSEGDKTLVSDFEPANEQVNKALGGLQGQIEQIPPVYSAIKVNGKRAYKLARQGKLPEIKPRQVTIYGYQNISYSYPALEFEVEVSKGTYIRALAEDIGKFLKTGAYLKSLTRLSVGKYQLEDSLKPGDITYEDITANLQTDVD